MKVDVVVAGGGPAGVAAAVASARMGADTILIEHEGYLGGMGTKGGVPAYGPFFDEGDPVIGGIGLEILNTLKKNDMIPKQAPKTKWYAIDSERLKLVLDDITTDSNVKLLFHTDVIGVKCENGHIKNVECFNKSGRFNIEANIFIDCTGDGDLAVMAGAEYEYGDREGNVQAATLCFKVANFDTGRFLTYMNEEGEDGNLSKASERARANGEFIEHETKVGGIALYADGTATFNFGHVFNVKPLEIFGLSNAEIEGRRLLPKLLGFVNKYVPGGENAYIAQSGPSIGIRETRRIKGLAHTDENDYYSRAHHTDGIAIYHYPIDIHTATPKNKSADEENYHNSRYNHGEYYDVPYGCLLPQKLDNVLVAGRCISTDRAMNASIRIMPICFATGEAAGTAAAMCIKEQTMPKDVDTDSLRMHLASNRCIIK